MSPLPAIAALLISPAGLQDPGLEIDWWVNGSFAGNLMPTGTWYENQQWWTYTGFATDFGTGVVDTIDFLLLLGIWGSP